MKRLILIGTALAVFAVPGAASAGPSSSDKINAAKECRTERGATPATREAFRARYGTNAGGKNAFGKCVSRRTRDEASERSSATANAAKQCKSERTQLGEAAFTAKYGSGKKGKNAFGKCVSQKAQAAKQQADQADAKAIATRKAAAKGCATERNQDRAAFQAKYGTNSNGRNAYGKCVSRAVKA